MHAGGRRREGGTHRADQRIPGLGRPGRKLTATGRIGLAYARQLVELLGTGDTIDPEVGGRVFKTRSSEDLAHLNRIAE